MLPIPIVSVFFLRNFVSEIWLLLNVKTMILNFEPKFWNFNSKFLEVVGKESPQEWKLARQHFSVQNFECAILDQK